VGKETTDNSIQVAVICAMESEDFVSRMNALGSVVGSVTVPKCCLIRSNKGRTSVKLSRGN
jgi:hypothetical protein